MKEGQGVWVGRSKRKANDLLFWGSEGQMGVSI
jgi:hypothetical protein